MIGAISNLSVEELLFDDGGSGKVWSISGDNIILLSLPKERILFLFLHFIFHYRKSWKAKILCYSLLGAHFRRVTKTGS